MASIFENLKESSGRWYDGLSDRERRLLALLFVVFVVVLSFSLVFFAVGKISTKQRLLSTTKSQISQIRELEIPYLEARRKSEAKKRKISRNDVSLFTFIQGVTSKLGITVRDLNEQRRPVPKSNLVETSVRLNLSKLSMDKATALIEEIETSPYGELIKVTKLKINKRFDEPELLDLQLTVSTWKSA